MKDIIQTRDESFVYLKHQVHTDHIETFVCSSCESVLCPYCGQASSKTHSTYQRIFRDVPIQKKKQLSIVSSGNASARTLNVHIIPLRSNLIA
jgi:hypothetical protein